MATEATNPRFQQARQRATALRNLNGQEIPLDVETVIGSLEIPVVERRLPETVRATVGTIAGQRAIILNKLWKFSSEAERRWVLAEELGHILLEHKLVESVSPGGRVELREPQHEVYEREARAFAAELLMPLPEVRKRWFDESSGYSGSHGTEEQNIRRLARDFAVTLTAMRVRLEQLHLV